MRVFARLRIDEVEARRFADLDDQIAAIEGLSTGAELQDILRVFYPKVTADTAMCIFRFGLVADE